MMKQKEKVDNDFYNNLSTKNQKLLLSFGREHIYRSGQILYRKGDQARKVYLILNGKIQLSNEIENNNQCFCQIKEKNDLVGDLTLSPTGYYSNSAKVLRRTFLIEFHKDDFEGVILHNSEIAMSYMQWLSKCNNLILNQYGDALVCHNINAVFLKMIHLCDTTGIHNGNSIYIKKRNFLKTLADFDGTTEAKIDFFLKELEKKKVITNKNRFIIIHDIKYFKDQLNCKLCSSIRCSQ